MRARLGLFCIGAVFGTLAGSNCPMQTGGGGGTSCTEDASAYVQVIVTQKQVLTRNSTCQSVATQLQTRTASVMFKNIHPTRKIAIAAIIIYQSDKRTLPVLVQRELENGEV